MMSSHEHESTGRGLSSAWRHPMLIPAGVLILTALVYWPVIHARFVWDDLIDFRDNPWLTQSHLWMHYVLRDFNHWTNYFRPLIVAFFTLQVRLFNVEPGPMHAVNLGMHLIITMLVGLLARAACRAADRSEKETAYMAGLCMLLYGLHPILIEPVTWIGCQFDLGATLFMLIGLLANIHIKGKLTRAVAVGLCFLLAAGCKESAISFPPILAVLDWALIFRRNEKSWRQNANIFLDRNWLTFVAILLAGVVYLAVRAWALGHLIGQFVNGPSTVLGRLQEVCFIYLHYWRTLFVPMLGMSPVHPVDIHRFDTVTLASIVTDVAAIAVVTSGIYYAVRRASALACIVVVVTAALFPVLHITSVAFDSSLFHERYVMTGLAAACGMLPLIRMPYLQQLVRQPIGKAATVIACIAWLLFSVVSIRITVPLWSNSVNLWRWALITNPKSLDADNNLLSAYLKRKDYADAQQFIDKLQSEHVHCPRCMLNAAILAVDENDPKRAMSALEYVRHSKEILGDKFMFSQYLAVTGKVLLLQHKWADAESVFRASCHITPLKLEPQLGLVIALALQGKTGAARTAMTSALSRLPPDKRANARQNIEQVIRTLRKEASIPAPH